MSRKPLEKSGLEPAAPNRLADRKHALRFIDSSKSPSTKIDGSLVNFRRRLSNRHGRPRRMLIWTFEGNTDQTVTSFETSTTTLQSFKASLSRCVGVGDEGKFDTPYTFGTGVDIGNPESPGYS